MAQEESRPAPRLCDEIMNKLATFLLSPIVARSERPKDIESIIRRLKKRFDVNTTDQLAVSFSLIEDPSIRRNVGSQSDGMCYWGESGSHRIIADRLNSN